MMNKTTLPIYIVLVGIGLGAPSGATAAAADTTIAGLAASPAPALTPDAHPVFAQVVQGNDRPNPIGRIVAIHGAAQVNRSGAAIALKVGEPVFQNDVLQSGNGSLAVTLADETTLTLAAHSQVAVNEFVYREGSGSNVAKLEFLRGVIAFAASRVAKTGEMKIVTPTATMGIRGTTGVVNLPRDAVSGETKVKLYADADGAVGRIEIFNIEGAALGVLSQRGAAYAVRLDGFSLQSGRPRYRAAAVRVSATESARDADLVRQLHASQNRGRRLIDRSR